MPNAKPADATDEEPAPMDPAPIHPLAEHLALSDAEGTDPPAPGFVSSDFGVSSFFGEVDDVLAAADFVAKLDYVDPSQLYLAGHSTGGTLVLLVAESSDRFRAVFSFGPTANILAYEDEATFDTSNEDEVRLRSPMFFLSSIRTPTFIFEGAVQPSNDGALPYLIPKDPAVPIWAYRVAGVDHFSILAPVTEVLAQKVVESPARMAVSNTELRAAVAKHRRRGPSTE